MATRDVPLASFMAGQGFYNDNSTTQAKAMTPAFPYLEAAAGAIQLDGSRIEIADYGASQGKNALEPMQLAINVIRKRSEALIPVRITHTDQPSNDFASLFTLLQTSPQSYLKLFPETYAAAAGKSFYTQIFPPASIDLMWSSIAVHWMSRIPAPLTDQIWSSFARGPVMAAFQAQSKQDWHDFLASRAIELKPEGRLVIAGGGSDEQGMTGAEPFFALANQVLQEMVEENILEQKEYEAFTIPVYHRKLEEYRAPFLAKPLADAFELAELKLEAVPDAQCAQYQKDRDREAFAQNLTGFLRGFSQNLFLAALDPGRSPEAKQQAAESFYTRFKDEVREDPDAVQFFWWIAALHARRRG